METAAADSNLVAAAETESRQEFRQLDEDVQDLKKEVLDLNRDLFLLEEELLFPANSQVAFFVSLDVGEYFKLDSVSLRIDGREVAVKVRRPGAREEMSADLRLLERFAELLEQEMSELRRFRPRRTVRHFARTIKAELDFRIEAKNLRAIATHMAESEQIVRDVRSGP